jgi:hypothetical protein
MSALMLVGVVALIGRVIYLVRGGGTQAVSAVAAAAPILPMVRLALPAGAEIRHVSLSGTRVAVGTAQPGAPDAITILDLATGAVVSRVMVDRAN